MLWLSTKENFHRAVQRRWEGKVEIEDQRRLKHKTPKPLKKERRILHEQGTPEVVPMALLRFSLLLSPIFRAYTRHVVAPEKTCRGQQHCISPTRTSEGGWTANRDTSRM